MGYGGYGPNGNNSARLPALFVLELGSNGGTLAPSSIQELSDWIEREVQFWSWSRNINTGNHKIALDQAQQPLWNAESETRQLPGLLQQGQDSAVQERLQRVQEFLKDAYLNQVLPHSTSVLGKRLEGLKSDAAMAIAFVYPFLRTGSNYHFDARDMSSWRGFLSGLAERFNLLDQQNSRVQAERDALFDLKSRAEKQLADKQLVVDALHRRYEESAAAIAQADEKQKQDFAQLLEQVNVRHAQALEAHETAMADLKRAFKDGMALRGPVNYWRRKARRHRVQSKRQMVRSFQSLGGLAAVLGFTAIWVFWTVNDNGVPHVWKVSVLILIAVLGIWATRLVIRMWLSNAHLATDAEERVTMVQTYLALLEDGKMTKDEDRALVWAPLFRPAADGLVKDEGLPHPILEMLTRSNK